MWCNAMLMSRSVILMLCSVVFRCVPLCSVVFCCVLSCHVSSVFLCCLLLCKYVCVCHSVYLRVSVHIYMYARVCLWHFSIQCTIFWAKILLHLLMFEAIPFHMTSTTFPAFNREAAARLSRASQEGQQLPGTMAVEGSWPIWPGRAIAVGHCWTLNVSKCNIR